jgi:hypothetical protein
MEYKLSSKAYKEALKESKLLGLKCGNCGAYTVPPRMVCGECASDQLEIVELSGRGRLQTFSIIYVPPEGFEAPYLVGLVELEEGPWVMANIEGVPPEEATMQLLGRKVRMGSKVLPGDRFSAGEWVALTFRLAD